MEEINLKVAGVEGLTSIPIRAELVATAKTEHYGSERVMELYRTERGYLTVWRDIVAGEEIQGGIIPWDDAAALKDGLTGTGGLPAEWGWEPSELDRELYEAARAAGIDFGDGEVDP